jgi:hypothetical protein
MYACPATRPEKFPSVKNANSESLSSNVIDVELCVTSAVPEVI